MEPLDLGETPPDNSENTLSQVTTSSSDLTNHSLGNSSNSISNNNNNNHATITNNSNSLTERTIIFINSLAILLSHHLLIHHKFHQENAINRLEKAKKISLEQWNEARKLLVTLHLLPQFDSYKNPEKRKNKSLAIQDVLTALHH